MQQEYKALLNKYQELEKKYDRLMYPPRSLRTVAYDIRFLIRFFKNIRQRTFSPLGSVLNRIVPTIIHV